MRILWSSYGSPMEYLWSSYGTTREQQASRTEAGGWRQVWKGGVEGGGERGLRRTAADLGAGTRCLQALHWTA